MKADDLCGRWQIRRTVYPLNGTIKNRLKGVGYFQKIADDKLHYYERLQYYQSTQTALTANQSYYYVFTPTQLKIYLSEQSTSATDVPFMVLDLQHNMSGTAMCLADYYQLQWHWLTPTEFTMQYTVNGPRKQHRIVSEFKREC